MALDAEKATKVLEAAAEEIKPRLYLVKRGTHKVHFVIDATGHGRTYLDDLDISEEVLGVEFEAMTGNVTRVKLHMLAMPAVLEVEGMVQLIVEPEDG